jgi:hypothetical protein
VGHVPGLQVLQGRRDLCGCANRPQGLLPASLRQLRVDKWITGVVLIAAQSTRLGQTQRVIPGYDATGHPHLHPGRLGRDGRQEAVRGADNAVLTKGVLGDPD